ncbi:MFS transporter [Mycetocola sp. JXN-3]|uniref:MFS transporter n=1 Tax=Mycetocola sp. JXN-3 TaxID=2116510 RepID=UPI00165D03E8|nr:MFS transporter [Mycetocola sp. JXN-3]
MSGHATTAPAVPSMWKQPTAVWAVVFASVIAFMGIGLVDPILPAIAKDLDATPAQAELLFTSYLLVTALAMFFSSWISSRLGAKRTLLLGLVIIVVFALGAALSGSVDEIIGFRAGWGLGNALFISTALATIVGAASGGAGSAIVLYEAALGVGIAVGPLLGGLLGNISWRGPFFGTASLMAIGFIAILTVLKKDPAKPAPVKITAAFSALRRPVLALLAATAFFYNVAFFILLAYSPFPLELGATGLGFVFFGWGVALAITSVVVAPILLRHFRRSRLLMVVLTALTVDLIAAGLVVHNRTGLIIAIIVGGLILGISNTVLTEAVMESTDLPRSVASSAYSGVRFLGGAVAPPVGALLAAAIAPAAPYYLAAAAALIGVLILILGRKALVSADEGHESAAEQAADIVLGDAA